MAEIALQKTVKKEEKAVKKEEGFLLREITYLEDFKKEIEEILKIKEEIQKFKSLRSSDKKIELLTKLLEKDEKILKKLKRKAGRRERRRIRYEKRVMGNIATLERQLDEPKKKELEDLIQQIHIYSGRVLREVALRAGEINKLLEKKDNNQQINELTLQKHINFTLEAGKALVALLERLEKFLENLENKVEEKKLIHSIHPDLVGLTGYLREGAIKTAVIKSIVPLKYFLEKGMAEKIKYARNSNLKIVPNKYGEKYFQIIEQYQDELRRVLTKEELNQLKKIDYKVLSSGVLIFLPSFKKPILGFNLHQMIDFSSPGWLFHALSGFHLKKISKDGFLSSPPEVILKKKNYFSKKFARDPNPRRLTDGISFAFQDHERWLSYSSGEVNEWSGGFFIFPIKNILKKDLILDFAKTIDGWPEIVLRDEIYTKISGALVVDILFASKKYSKWIEKYDDAKVFFKECKNNIQILQEIENSLKGEEVMRTETSGKSILFAKKFELLGIVEWNERMDRAMGEEFGNRMEKAYEKNKKGKEYLDLYEESNKKRKEIKEEHLRGQALFEGKGYFYERLAKIYLNKEILQDLITFVIEDNFFQFSLLAESQVNISYGEKALVPPLARFARSESPLFFNGTIFQQGLDYLNFPAIKGNIFPGICLTLNLMKEKPNLFVSKGTYSTKDYLDFIKKMKPKQVEKLFKQTHCELIKSLTLIIPRRYRTNQSQACQVAINKGVLFLNDKYKDKETLLRLVQGGQLIFSQFSKSTNSEFNKGEVSLFLSKILNTKNLLLGYRKYGQSYFYLKGNKLNIHVRETGKEYKVG